MPNHVKRHISCIFFIVIFLWLFVYYAQIHPVFVFSGDDWTYISNGRSAIPLLTEWNPSRIFPETIMPLVAGFAVHFINPMIQDYLLSLSLTFAAFIAIFISIYLYVVYRYLRSVYLLDDGQAVISVGIFLFFHYYMFASGDAENLHLFYIYDLTNCFYYMLPTLLNILIVLFLSWMETKGKRIADLPLPVSGCLCLMIYLAIFSNLFSGYILAIYAGIFLVNSVLKNSKRVSLQCLFMDIAPYIVMLALFMISMILELLGTRASNIENRSLEIAAARTVRVLIARLWHVKKLFLIVAFILIVLSFFSTRQKHSQDLRPDNISWTWIHLTKRSLLFSALSILWVTALCIASNPDYIQRMDVLLGPAAFLIFCVTSTIAYLIKSFPKAIVIVPLLLYVGISTIWSIEGRSFRGDANPSGWIALENHHIRQFIDADTAGEDTVNLELTEIYEEKWMGERISRALYKHGIISRELAVNPFFNPHLKELYQLSTPHMPWNDLSTD